jgi:carboxymethylenebutenolidase
MTVLDLRIKATGGGEFDCHLALPATSGKVPAVVLAAAVHGVDEDIRSIAAEVASMGFIAAAPDLFWRTIPGPLPRSDKRTGERAEPRGTVIAAGEADLVDTLAMLKTQPSFNGRAAVAGFCFGGPYALIGPRRLGFEVGVSCHGSAMEDFIAEAEGVGAPVCLLWGDRDNRAPPPVLDAYRKLTAESSNVELHVFPGVQHGYMMKGDERHDPAAYAASMKRIGELLAGLR